MGFELTNTDHQIVTMLETGRCTESELVEYTGVEADQIRERVTALESRGFIRRTSETPPTFELVTDPR